MLLNLHPIPELEDHPLSAVRMGVDGVSSGSCPKVVFGIRGVNLLFYYQRINVKTLLTLKALNGQELKVPLHAVCPLHVNLRNSWLCICTIHYNKTCLERKH
jgi:hypothetical protein